MVFSLVTMKTTFMECLLYARHLENSNVCLRSYLFYFILEHYWFTMLCLLEGYRKVISLYINIYIYTYTHTYMHIFFFRSHCIHKKAEACGGHRIFQQILKDGSRLKVRQLTWAPVASTTIRQVHHLLITGANVWSRDKFKHANAEKQELQEHSVLQPQMDVGWCCADLSLTLFYRDFYL